MSKAGLQSKKVPVMSFSIAEDELRVMGAGHMVGHYACWNYFQSVQTEENKKFVANFRARYGANRVTDDPMEAGYIGAHLWARAVTDAGSTKVPDVLSTMEDLSIKAPGGIVSFNAENHHVWNHVRIGKITDSGQFSIVWRSKNPIRPVPYPIFRSKEDWDSLLKKLYALWGGSWARRGR